MKNIILFFSLIFLVLNASATHNMASDISYTHMGGNTYKIRVRTFTNTDPNTTQADRCDIVIYFGDGDSAMAPRINGPSNYCPTADGEPVATFIKKNVYEVTHTYSGYGNYTISVEDPNRVSGICNIPNSVDVSFWLGAEIKVSANSVNNSSPQYTGIPMVADTVGVVSYYTPALTEVDSDSLSYELITPMGNGLPLVGFTLPPSSTDFSINPVTGLVTWNAPTTICNYVYAIKIKEWRIISGTPYLIGSTMQEVWNRGEAYTSVSSVGRSVLNVYPNPSFGIVNFSVPESFVTADYSLEIFNSLGQRIIELDGQPSATVLAVENLSNGIYSYCLKGSTGKLSRGTFIVSGSFENK